MIPPPSPPSAERLLELIDLMAHQPVAMLVDLVADRFISGSPKRISREAPVLILRHDGDTLVPGGGANAVANVAALGGRALPFGVVGSDRSGRRLLELFSQRGIETRGILVSEGYRTPTKTRVLAGGRHAIKQQVVRYDIEDTWTPTAAEEGDLANRMGDLAQGARVAVASDYGYGAVGDGPLVALRRALGSAVPILGDSRYRLGVLGGLDGATPNLEEAEALCGVPLDDRDQLVAAGERQRRSLGMGFLLVTRGSAGMTLFVPGFAVHMPVHGTDQVADVTGAGDTVIGTFALSLAAGAQPLEAACLANYAGGVVVMKMGTATLDRDELRRAVLSDPNPLGAITSDPTG
ncbi:MAG: PfkB family carbohydrate kinase [Acidobacteriota bacterium]